MGDFFADDRAAIARYKEERESFLRGLKKTGLLEKDNFLVKVAKVKSKEEQSSELKEEQDEGQIVFCVSDDEILVKIPAEKCLEKVAEVKSQEKICEKPKPTISSSISSSGEPTVEAGIAKFSVPKADPIYRLITRVGNRKEPNFTWDEIERLSQSPLLRSYFLNKDNGNPQTLPGLWKYVANYFSAIGGRGDPQIREMEFGADEIVESNLESFFQEKIKNADQHFLSEFVSNLNALELQKGHLKEFFNSENFKKIKTHCERGKKAPVHALMYEYVSWLLKEKKISDAGLQKKFEEYKAQYGLIAYIERKIQRHLEVYYKDMSPKDTWEKLLKDCPALADRDVQKALSDRTIRISDILPVRGWQKVARLARWFIEVKFGRFTDFGKTLSLLHCYRIIINKYVNTEANRLAISNAIKRYTKAYKRESLGDCFGIPLPIECFYRGKFGEIRDGNFANWLKIYVKGSMRKFILSKVDSVEEGKKGEYETLRKFIDLSQSLDQSELSKELKELEKSKPGSQALLLAQFNDLNKEGEKRKLVEALSIWFELDAKSDLRNILKEDETAKLKENLKEVDAKLDLKNLRDNLIKLSFQVLSDLDAIKQKKEEQVLRELLRLSQLAGRLDVDIKLENLTYSQMVNLVVMYDLSSVIPVIGKWQYRIKRAIGGVLAFSKVISSAALCVTLLQGFLVALSGAALWAITLGAAACNGVAAMWTRGSKMLNLPVYANKVQVLKEDPWLSRWDIVAERSGFKRKSRCDSGRFCWLWKICYFFKLLYYLCKLYFKKPLLRLSVYVAAVAGGLTGFFGLSSGLTAVLGLVGLGAFCATPVGAGIILGLAVFFSIAATVSYLAFQGADIEKNFDTFCKLFADAWYETPNKLMAVGKIIGLSLIAGISTTVYFVITFFTTSKGADKLLGGISYAQWLAGTVTVVNTIVNMFSQVYKVCELIKNLSTYVRSGNVEACNTGESEQSLKNAREMQRLQQSFSKAEKISQKFSCLWKMTKLSMVMIGDVFSYAIAGGYGGAVEDAGKMGWGTIAKWFFVISVVSVLAAFSIAFSWWPILKDPIKGAFTTAEKHKVATAVVSVLIPPIGLVMLTYSVLNAKRIGMHAENHKVGAAIASFLFPPYGLLMLTYCLFNVRRIWRGIFSSSKAKAEGARDIEIAVVGDPPIAQAENVVSTASSLNVSRSVSPNPVDGLIVHVPILEQDKQDILEQNASVVSLDSPDRAMNGLRSLTPSVDIAMNSPSPIVYKADVSSAASLLITDSAINGSHLFELPPDIRRGARITSDLQRDERAPQQDNSKGIQQAKTPVLPSKGPSTGVEGRSPGPRAPSSPFPGRDCCGPLGILSQPEASEAYEASEVVYGLDLALSSKKSTKVAAAVKLPGKVCEGLCEQNGSGGSTSGKALTSVSSRSILEGLVANAANGLELIGSDCCTRQQNEIRFIRTVLPSPELDLAFDSSLLTKVKEQAATYVCKGLCEGLSKMGATDRPPNSCLDAFKLVSANKDVGKLALAEAVRDSCKKQSDGVVSSPPCAAPTVLA